MRNRRKKELEIVIVRDIELSLFEEEDDYFLLEFEKEDEEVKIELDKSKVKGKVFIIVKFKKVCKVMFF